jgi:hypothetical protein
VKSRTKKKSPGRPRRDPKFARLNKTVRCHPLTWAKLARRAKTRKTSIGVVIDQLAKPIRLR